MTMLAKHQNQGNAGLAGFADVTQVHIKWKAQQLLSVYRVILAIILIAVYLSPLPSSLGSSKPDLFGGVLVLYFAYVLTGVACAKLKKPFFEFQVYSNAIIDIFCITLLMHSSGGINSGLAILLIVAITAAGILTASRAALAMAAGASLLLLLEHSYSVLTLTAEPDQFFQVGLLGFALFVIAYATNVFAQQLKASQSLARQREIDLANMEQLNEYIVQRMESGVLVIDARKNILLMNESAWYLLSMPPKAGHMMLEQISPELNRELDFWRESDNYEPKVIRTTGTSAVFPRFTRLGTKDYAGVLVILEDTSMLDQQAQHLKMTAMGRLTASIAHEIRNPLGAISHAGQLLEESSNLDGADKRLTQIIREQAVRMNSIIENIMQLTRRDQAKPESIKLKDWLEDFIADFIRNHDLSADTIQYEISPDSVLVMFDPSHLHQIMSNLCQNAVRHGKGKNEKIVVEINGGENRDSRGPFLDVIDSGPGIEPEMAKQIFEPFFTTASKGTGLGLYIARELAEANQAHLDYVPIPRGGSCFRITFAKKNIR